MRARALLALVAAVTFTVGVAVPGHAYPKPGLTEMESVTSKGAHPDLPETEAALQKFGLDSAREWPLATSITPNGRYVAFVTALPLVAKDVNDAYDVYVHDRRTGKTELASQSSQGAVAVGPPGVAPQAVHACHDASGRVLDLSCDSSISANGRYVAFESAAVNLVPGDTNLVTDIFVHDMKTGVTEAASVDRRGNVPNASEGDGVNLPSSTAPSISGSGRYVSFTSVSSALVAGDTNHASDVFVRDMVKNVTRRVSVASGGAQSAGSCGFGDCYSWTPSSSISGNGRYVAFDSIASDLVPGDTNGVFDVFVHDMRTGKTTRVSVASDGSQANDPEGGGFFPGMAGSVLSWDEGFLAMSAQHVLSYDGRYVTFVSRAWNLVPNDTNRTPSPAASAGGMDVFVHDRKTGRTERVSVTSMGEQTNYYFDDFAISPSLSPDGRYVAFTGSPWLDGPNPLLPRWYGVVRYDRGLGIADPVPHGSAPPPDYVFGDPDLSAGGRYMAFSSGDDGLAKGDHNQAYDTFVRDFGPPTGGSLGGGGSSQPPPQSGVQICIDANTCIPPGGSVMWRHSDADATLGRTGADLSGAELSNRPQFRDLFVREEVRGMPSVAGSPLAGMPGVLYGLDLRVHGIRYEVRVQRVPGPSFDIAGGASFGLFRRDAAGQWTEVASLRGGYGTTGDEVVFSLPLRDLGLRNGGRLNHVRAFTALGTFAAGSVHVIDQEVVSR